jgi:hypothetical protein
VECGVWRARGRRGAPLRLAECGVLRDESERGERRRAHGESLRALRRRGGAGCRMAWPTAPREGFAMEVGGGRLGRGFAVDCACAGACWDDAERVECHQLLSRLW